jgi:hypothetical protein
MKKDAGLRFIWWQDACPTPRPPTDTRVKRLLAYLWASPNSLLGLLLALGGRHWHWREGVLEVSGAWLPRLCGRHVEAVTLGHIILARHPDCLTRWREHERVHVRQYERYGPLFLPAYFGLAAYTYLRGGHPYRDHPLERQAGLNQ